MRRIKKKTEDLFGEDDMVSQCFVLGISLGCGVGILFGLVMGSALGNVGAGLSIGLTTGTSLGMCIGVAIGYAVREQKEKKWSQPNSSSKNKRLIRAN